MRHNLLSKSPDRSDERDDPINNLFAKKFNNCQEEDLMDVHLPRRSSLVYLKDELDNFYKVDEEVFMRL